MGNLYYQIVDVTDCGPYVTKLVLGLPREVSAEELDPGLFSVYVEIKDKSGRIVELPRSFIQRDELVPCRGYRPVRAAYPSTLEGEAVPGKSRFAALEMPYGPIWSCSAALAADFRSLNGHGAYTVRDYRVTLLGAIGSGEDALQGLVFDTCAGVFNPKAERFAKGVSSYAPLPIRYGYFVPRKLDGKKALIIFLHGAGEGGQDLPIAWSGNKVTEFTEQWMQDRFGGAFVLVPQCDTMWMDDGSGAYGDSGRSMYTEALKALIDEFIANHSGAIDRTRVYIGGDSNGGFMTMRMLMSYPGAFTAAFPICEAMLDERVSDEDIRSLRSIPIWFVHAQNDPVVRPERYTLATYKRLMEAGAENCHFSFPERIVDIHAGFTKENGEPYEYLGHFAWVPVFNDDCSEDFDGRPVLIDGRQVTLMQWLAAQKRPV